MNEWQALGLFLLLGVASAAVGVWSGVRRVRAARGRGAAYEVEFLLRAPKFVHTYLVWFAIGAGVFVALGIIALFRSPIAGGFILLMGAMICVQIGASEAFFHFTRPGADGVSQSLQ